MEGVGGDSTGISWTRYSGVRRSKFIPERDEALDPTPHATPTLPKNDMWTEITKDLVLKDAIEQKGYKYEETPLFFYVMEYLRYVSIGLSLHS